jgi:hypothetical protein
MSIVTVQHTSAAEHSYNISTNSGCSSDRAATLLALKDYLLRGLRPVDVILDEYGVQLFNVNQSAYMIEESATMDQKRATRNRISMTPCANKFLRKRCPLSGKGVSTCD